MKPWSHFRCGLMILAAALQGTTAASAADTSWWPPFVPDVPAPAAESSPAATPAGEPLVIDGSECAGISGFRKDWDRPIPLAADGAMKERTGETKLFGAGAYADWDDPVKPGAIACDAVHRSLLVRFPGAAERIVAALKQGKRVARAEIVLPYLGSEIFPPPAYMDPQGLSFLGQTWREKAPRWHAVAWALNRPWVADRAIGPTYNAFINSAGYWAGYGARETGKDRLPGDFGPTPLDQERPEGRLDITASLNDPAYGADLGSRLRRLEDCGFLVRKWEVYDASFWGSLVSSGAGYEWGTMTGPRGLLLGKPKLVLYLQSGGASETPALPPPADVRKLAATLAGGKGGQPTAVLPSKSQIEGWIARFGRGRPAWLDEAAWQRTQQLWSIDKTPNAYGFPSTVEEYGPWLDRLLAMAPRSWHGFDACIDLGAKPLRYREALPAPVLDHVRLFWWSWLLPDRDYRAGFDHAGQHHAFAQGYAGRKEFGEYYAKTRDWRGNFSVYRTYSYVMGTMNFNHWASGGTLLGGELLGSDRMVADGRHGLVAFPLKTWCWFDGSTQESIDHYYLAISLRAQKVFADFGPAVEDRLMGQAILAKSVAEIASCLHPRLKRFTSSSGRTGIGHTLATQDGLNHILHPLMPDGALTDFGRKTVGDGVPVIGHDLPPGQVATLFLDGPWAPAWYGRAFAAKPVPYQMTASYKMWGMYGQTPLWKRSFQARHYGVASLDVATNESVPLLVNWRRDDRPVEAAEQLGVLLGRFGVNRTELLKTSGGIVGMQGGPTCTVQHRNRLIVLGTPNRGLPFENKPAPAEVTSIQTTLGLLSLTSPALEILVDGKPATVPMQIKAGQRVVIRDGVTLLGIIPLPGTDLGRGDVEAEIVADGKPTELHHVAGKAAETLRIHAYNYRGEPLPKDQWTGEKFDDAWSGFCVQAADTSEFKDAKAFDAHLATGKLEAAWDAGNRQVAIEWSLGGEPLACVFKPSGTGKAPTTDLLPSRSVNGKWLYLPRGIERECDLSIMGTTGRIEKHGAALEGEEFPQGRMLSLLTDPEQGIFEAWQPFPEPTSLALKLPGGARIEPLGKIGVTRITVFSKGNRIEIDGAIAGPGRATKVALSGFPKGIKALLNGQPVATRSAKIDGRSVEVIPLSDEVDDGDESPESAAAILPIPEGAAFWFAADAAGTLAKSDGSPVSAHGDEVDMWTSPPPRAFLSDANYTDKVPIPGKAARFIAKVGDSDDGVTRFRTRPTYLASGANGKPAVRFATVDNRNGSALGFLDAKGMALGKDVEARSVVMAIRPVAAAAATGCVLGGTDGNYQCGVAWEGYPGAKTGLEIRLSDEKTRANVTGTLGKPAAMAGKWHVVAFSTTNREASVPAFACVDGGPIMPLGTAPCNFRFGLLGTTHDGGGHARSTDVDIAELIVYQDRCLTSDEIRGVMGYLGRKYRVENQPTIFMIGDSTMADYGAGSTRQGWGMALGAFLSDASLVRNHAKPGRSSKSFREEGLWAPVLDNLRPGDWVVIQFGHNDDDPGRPALYADPSTTFRENLRGYINDARGKGAVPILVTPVCRRVFGPDGRHTDTHLHPQGSYPDAVRAVAKDEKTPLIDLEAATARWLDKLGDDASKQFYFIGVDPTSKDNSHFSEAGAKAVAEMAVEQLRAAKLALP